MTLTGYKWQGVAIRTASGDLAGSPACCCDQVLPCDYCPPHTDTFTGTVSAKTGDATQLPDSFQVAYSGINGDWTADYSVLGGTWGEPCSEGDIYISISCAPDTFPNPPLWSVAIGATWGASATLVSATCTNGKWTVVVDYELLGVCGSGTFTVTWVQD